MMISALLRDRLGLVLAYTGRRVGFLSYFAPGEGCQGAPKTLYIKDRFFAIFTL